MKSLFACRSEYLGLPFISLALIPPLVPDNRYPPFYFGWSGRQRWWARVRNEIAIRVQIGISRSAIHFTGADSAPGARQPVSALLFWLVGKPALVGPRAQ